MDSLRYLHGKLEKLYGDQWKMFGKWSSTTENYANQLIELIGSIIMKYRDLPPEDREQIVLEAEKILDMFDVACEMNDFYEFRVAFENFAETLCAHGLAIKSNLEEGKQRLAA